MPKGMPVCLQSFQRYVKAAKKRLFKLVYGDADAWLQLPINRFPSRICPSKLNRTKERIKRRHEIAAGYYEVFKDIAQITNRNYENGE